MELNDSSWRTFNAQAVRQTPHLTASNVRPLTPATKAKESLQSAPRCRAATTALAKALSAATKRQYLSGFNVWLLNGKQFTTGELPLTLAQVLYSKEFGEGMSVMLCFACHWRFALVLCSSPSPPRACRACLSSFQRRFLVISGSGLTILLILISHSPAPLPYTCILTSPLSAFATPSPFLSPRLSFFSLSSWSCMLFPVDISVLCSVYHRIGAAEGTEAPLGKGSSDSRHADALVAATNRRAV